MKYLSLLLLIFILASCGKSIEGTWRVEAEEASIPDIWEFKNGVITSEVTGQNLYYIKNDNTIQISPVQGSFDVLPPIFVDFMDKDNITLIPTTSDGSFSRMNLRRY